MEIKETSRTRTTKTVVLAATDAPEAIAYALIHAGETEASVFGKMVTEKPGYPGIFTVTLYTD